MTQQRVLDAAAAAKAAWLRSARESLRKWPAPLLADLDPPELLGVTESSLADRYAEGPLAPYVERDIDRIARERLRSKGLLLLVGAPASGVTRTAYETALSDPVPRHVLAPISPDGLRRAIDELDVLSHLATRTSLMLWLDRVDRFAPSGLTVRMLRECRERSPGLRVVATVLSTCYLAWATEQADLAAEFGAPVMLERLASGPELARAKSAYPDVDFTEGIAPAFTATGSLLRRMAAGDRSCPFEPVGGDCALARAVLHVAIGWVGTGTPRALSAVTTSGLVQQRLGRPGEPDRSHLAHALEWWASPATDGAALLTLGMLGAQVETLAPHAGVAEVVNLETTPDDDVWTTALNDVHSAADSEGLGRIGYQAHVRGILHVSGAAWDMVREADEPAAEALRRAASFSESRRDYAAAIPLRERMLRIVETTSGPDDPELAVALMMLAVAVEGSGEVAKARDMFERALAIDERSYGPDHLQVALMLHNLGVILNTLGEPTKAREVLERALSIKERALGTEHHEVAVTLKSIGRSFMLLREPAKARDLYERSLSIRERAFGPDHLEVADSLASLGIAWRELEEPAKALELLDRALSIEERELGRHDPDVGDTLSDLGLVWMDLRDPFKARDLLERALAIKSRFYGPDHRRVAGTLNSLGEVWIHLGEPAKARDMFERVLAIDERLYGSNHLEVAGPLGNLGVACAEAGAPGKARDLIERALAIEERALGPDHPKVAGTLGNLGNVWNELGNPDKAREVYLKALGILRANPEGNRSAMADIVRRLRRVDPDLVIRSDGRTAGLRSSGDDHGDAWTDEEGH
ncbi:tetratricopeptide repeat protein [Kribbella sp. NBC_00889]|uniref:tetratricopeptide repeat protein n=1 Tax=Kribbella sp. NBC_00889 TaxID=2975974 RepID=UPI0038705F39|nr:tetratricopeptide repeat protein [Kribbella sp. NBC_00889]